MIEGWDEKLQRFVAIDGVIDMNEAEKNFLENRFLNLDSRCTAIEHELVIYMEKNPKVTDEWVESRLRALEAKVKQLEEGQ